MQPITMIQFAVRVGAYVRTNTDAPCMFGRCLGGNLCQIYSSRGDSGPMSHFSDSSPLHANSHSCISQKVHAVIPVIPVQRQGLSCRWP